MNIGLTTSNIDESYSFMVAQEHTELINEIKALQADRQKHAEAIASIDAVLARIGKTIASMRLDENSTAGHATPESHRPGTRAQKYRKLPLTGEEFVLDLVRRHGAVTTSEINSAWRAEGRGGVANNVIGRLLKDGLILREPLEGQRGSLYRPAVNKAN